MGLFKELIKSKDKIISEMGKKYLDSKIEDYGSIDTFIVSSSTKEIYAKLILKGDLEPVEISIKNYFFENINDEIYLAFEKILCSREWIDNLINNHLDRFAENNRIKIPDKYGGIAQIVL